MIKLETSSSEFAWHDKIIIKIGDVSKLYKLWQGHEISEAKKTEQSTQAKGITEWIELIVRNVRLNIISRFNDHKNLTHLKTGKWKKVHRTCELHLHEDLHKTDKLKEDLQANLGRK